MKRYHGFKTSVTCLFRVARFGTSRHASDIKNMYERQSFIKARKNGGTITKLMMA